MAGGNFSIFNMGSYPAYTGQALCYVNSAEIFALTYKPAADSSLIFKCTNWDSGWVPVLKTKPACYDISFADANTGIVCGNFGVFRRTTDAGATWQNLTPAGSTTILACKMNNLLTGYFVCGAGLIYKSTNNGANWFTQNSGTSFLLYDIDIINNDSAAFAAGENGTILKTGSGSFTFIEPLLNITPNRYKLEQNFPNPFNPETKIKFSIENEANVSLKVYDITGKLVNEMLNELLPAGVHEVNFNASGLTSGIYFYCMESNGTKLSKKMLLIK